MAETYHTGFTEVFEFRVALKHIKPEIWRIVQVPKTYNFDQLNLAIQAAMGWQNCHQHNFGIKGETITLDGDLDDGMDELHFRFYFGDLKKPDLKTCEVKIAQYFFNVGDSATYLYDFGDNWEHKVTLMKILQADKKIVYPVLVAGERACPPEGEIVDEEIKLLTFI